MCGIYITLMAVGTELECLQHFRKRVASDLMVYIHVSVAATHVIVVGMLWLVMHAAIR